MEETKTNYWKFLCKLLTGEDEPKFLTDRERVIIQRFEKEYELLLDQQQAALERLSKAQDRNRELHEALADSYELAKCGWAHNYPNEDYRNSKKLSKAIAIMHPEVLNQP